MKRDIKQIRQDLVNYFANIEKRAEIAQMIMHRIDLAFDVDHGVVRLTPETEHDLELCETYEDRIRSGFEFCLPELELELDV